MAEKMKRDERRKKKDSYSGPTLEQQAAKQAYLHVEVIQPLSGQFVNRAETLIRLAKAEPASTAASCLLALNKWVRSSYPHQVMGLKTFLGQLATGQEPPVYTMQSMEQGVATVTDDLVHKQREVGLNDAEKGTKEKANVIALRKEDLAWSDLTVEEDYLKRRLVAGLYLAYLRGLELINQSFGETYPFEWPNKLLDDKKK